MALITVIEGDCSQQNLWETTRLNSEVPLIQNLVCKTRETALNLSRCRSPLGSDSINLILAALSSREITTMMMK